MRKLGFTLAEVLITLGIIGVIATLTMPTLMSNTAEREYSTALKKAISALTEAIQMNVALENTSFDELYDKGGGPGTEEVDGEVVVKATTEANSLEAFLLNRMQTEKYAKLNSLEVCDSSSKSAKTASCLDYGPVAAAAASEADAAMFFRDGSAIIFNSQKVISDADCKDANGSTVDCFHVVYDINGVKKPNLVANCSNSKAKGAEAKDAERQGTQKCTKDNFIARDQYPLALYGMGAYPDSPAAKYMWERK